LTLAAAACGSPSEPDLFDNSALPDAAPDAAGAAGASGNRGDTGTTSERGGQSGAAGMSVADAGAMDASTGDAEPAVDSAPGLDSAADAPGEAGATTDAGTGTVDAASEAADAAAGTGGNDGGGDGASGGGGGASGDDAGDVGTVVDSGASGSAGAGGSAAADATGGAGGSAGATGSGGSPADGSAGSGGAAGDDASADVSTGSGGSNADAGTGGAGGASTEAGTDASDDAAEVAPAIAVTLCPKHTVLLTGESMAFSADVTGAADPGVFYGIVGGTSAGGSDSGSVDQGSITSDGLYVAPSTPGTYQVIAKSKQDTSKSDTATVTVVATSAVRTIRGTISGPAGAGPIYVRVKDGEAGQTMLLALGPYTIRGVAIDPWITSITVQAFRDVNGNGGYVSSLDPFGSTSVSWSGSSVSGADVTLVSPGAPSLPQAPQGLRVSPSDKGAFVQWDLLADANGNEYPQSYRIYASTSANPGPSDAGASITKTVPAGGINSSILSPLTNGTPFYFAITAVTGNTESPTSTVVGPVTIGAPTGGHSVSGTISFGFTPTGPLYAVVGTGTLGFWSTRIDNPVSPQSFTITGVPDGRYDFGAVFDLNSDGLLDASDPMSFRRHDVSPLVVVAGSDVSNVSVSLPATDGMAWVSTQYIQEDSSSPSYRLRLGVGGNLKQVVKAVVISGPGVVAPIDMRADGTDAYMSQIDNVALPTVGSVYELEATYADGKTCTLSAPVTGVWTSLPQSLAPSGSGTGSATPTFTWAAPLVTPSVYWYRMNVWPNNSSNGDLWYTSMPSSFTSLLFNDNGGASISALVSGGSYQWALSATDPAGNIAARKVTFSVP
jgi:hypothetical protein